MKPYGTDLTADWMNATPSDWMDRLVPGWRQSSYGNLLRAGPPDWMRWLPPQYPGAMGAFARGPHHSPWHHGWHHRDCQCRDCGERDSRHCRCDPCECMCCIGDVDLVVYARVAEVRVIPIVVENPRRREKSVTVELSNWRTRGGAVLVETVDVGPKSFVLPACGEQKIVIGVRVRKPEQAGASENAAGVALTNPQDREIPDVDDCVVATADLTLVGCDHRPIRIAIAVLPHHCEPYRTDCGCGCC